MRAFRMLILVVLTISVFGVGRGQQASKDVSIEITQRKEKYILTVPVSRLVMTVPKGDLTRVHNSNGGSADSPRYFIFEDETHHLIVSGWFESDDNFPGVKQFWAEEMAAWKQRNLPEAQDVIFEDIGSWKAILYDINIPGTGNSHVRAHWVQDGTWIDVHISLTSNESQTGRRNRLREALKAIQVSEKKL